MNNAETDAFGEKIDPEWFKWVIHRLDSSIRKLGLMPTLAEQRKPYFVR